MGAFSAPAARRPTEERTVEALSEEAIAEDRRVAREYLRALPDHEFYLFWPKLTIEARSAAGVEFIDRFRRISPYKPKIVGAFLDPDHFAAKAAERDPNERPRRDRPPGARCCLALLCRERRRVIEFVFSSVAAAGSF